jgi:hypothetical protein
MVEQSPGENPIGRCGGSLVASRQQLALATQWIGDDTALLLREKAPVRIQLVSSPFPLRRKRNSRRGAALQ